MRRLQTGEGERASNEKQVRAGVIGLGRSRWAIRCKAFRSQQQILKVVAVRDPIALWMNEAKNEVACVAHDSVAGLLADENVETVVIASPNKYLAEHAMQALEVGKHALCARPLALTAADVDCMMAAANKFGGRPAAIPVTLSSGSGSTGRVRRSDRAQRLPSELTYHLRKNRPLHLPRRSWHKGNT